ncbi:hypothetical protein ACP4OV_007561 [Aristida adscensionis]
MNQGTRNATTTLHTRWLLLSLPNNQGNAMYAEIPASELEAKRPLLEEGGVYIISRFRVSNAKSFYRPVDAKYMIEFTCYTKINQPRKTPVCSRALHMIWSLSRILLGTLETIRDVLGIVTQISDTLALCNSLISQRLLTAGTLSSDTLAPSRSSSLSQASELEFSADRIPNQEPADPLVVLFVGTLSVAPYVSVPHGHHPPLAHVPPLVQQGHLSNVPVHVEHKQLDELEALDPYDSPAIIGTVVIARLVPGTKWWFAFCNRRSRTCSPNGAGYKCNACSCDGFKFNAEMIAFAQPPQEDDPMDHDDLRDGQAGANVSEMDNTSKKLKSSGNQKESSRAPASASGPSTSQCSIAVTPFGKHRPRPPLRISEISVKENPDLIAVTPKSPVGQIRFNNEIVAGSEPVAQVFGMSQVPATMPTAAAAPSPVLHGEGQIEALSPEKNIKDETMTDVAVLGMDTDTIKVGSSSDSQGLGVGTATPMDVGRMRGSPNIRAAPGLVMRQALDIESTICAAAAAVLPTIPDIRGQVEPCPTNEQTQGLGEVAATPMDVGRTRSSLDVRSAPSLMMQSAIASSTGIQPTQKAPSSKQATTLGGCNSNYWYGSFP